MASSKTFVQHMMECIAECETKAQAVGLGKIENLLLKMAQKIDEGVGSGSSGTSEEKVIIKCSQPFATIKGLSNGTRFSVTINKQVSKKQIAAEFAKGNLVVLFGSGDIENLFVSRGSYSSTKDVLEIRAYSLMNSSYIQFTIDSTSTGSCTKKSNG